MSPLPNDDRFAGAKVLIAEDEAAIRQNLSRLLTIEGFAVRTAENGKEALALARAELPDIVLSDVMMPELDGHGLLAALRAEPMTAHVPFVFLTARADRSDIREGMNLGADDYLTKPFQREEVLSTLRARIARRRQEADSQATLRQAANRLLHYDPVTDLPNRTLLLEKMHAARQICQRRNTSAAVMVLGLDGFSRINDSLGHAAGDHVLRELADRLFQQVQSSAFVGELDTVARLGGDMFAVLLVDFDDEPFLSEYCGRLTTALAGATRVGGTEVFLGACAGIALYPRDGDSPESLLEHAETALHHAKTAGPGQRRFFAGDMNARAARRLRLHNDLHRALAQGEISLHYQPQVAVESGALIGFESLMRWQHAELGMVSPAEFIPVAEENGLIVALGTWALGEAARQTQSWRAQGLGDYRMAVNLSTRQFAAGDLVEQVARALRESALPPALLELEITESIAMHGVERTIETLNELKAQGVKLAMDDFGTGYSSLSYLKRFPIDTLKIDQSFVRNLHTDPGDAAIARAVIALAHSFGMSVIAEGVETAEILQYLADLSCEEYQGYYFSKPLPAEQATALLRRRQNDRAGASVNT